MGVLAPFSQDGAPIHRVCAPSLTGIRNNNPPPETRYFWLKTVALKGLSFEIWHRDFITSFDLSFLKELSRNHEKSCKLSAIDVFAKNSTVQANTNFVTCTDHSYDALLMFLSATLLNKVLPFSASFLCTMRSHDVLKNSVNFLPCSNYTLKIQSAS
jgi:hypothetical protein